VTHHLRLLLSAAALLVVAAAEAQSVRRGLPGGQRDSAAARRPGSGTIDGFVGDTALAPLLSAEVKILSTNVRVNTGPNGRFRISQVPAGPYILIVRRAGYAPTSTVIEVPAADTLRLSYTLERAATSLAPAIITAAAVSRRNMEFEQRRKLGRGEFMSAEDITRRNSVYTTELMRRFTSVNVSPSSTNYHGGMPDYYAMSRRESGSLTNAQQQYCPMSVYVDNIPMPTPFNLDLLPSPRNLMGIEVYSGPATTPPQYAGFNKGCGVILVWTKDGY
jgi:hypothetical protein